MPWIPLLVGSLTLLITTLILLSSDWNKFKTEFDSKQEKLNNTWESLKPYTQTKGE